MPKPAFNLKTYQPGRGALTAGAYGLAFLLFLAVAWISSVVIETRSANLVTSRLLSEGYTWANVQTNGLQVILTGTAPNEAARFRAVNIAGTEVESTRVRDDLDVTPARAVQAPRFSIEMLRNDDGIQLIGLLPEGTHKETLTSAAAALVEPTLFSNMLETAAYPAPEGWEAAFDFGLEALKALPRTKISVSADGVTITAIARSDQEKSDFEATLEALRPKGIAIQVDVTAPRPVLTPFTLRFVKDASGARFDACSTDSDKARMQILDAAAKAGADVSQGCVVGLGVPSPSWGAATAAGIAAVAQLPEATITFSDADVTIQAGPTTPQADFDRVVGEFRQALPDVFSLDATLEKTASTVDSGPAEFTATLAADTGKVELRGRLTDQLLADATESLANARFGAGKVYMATRLDPELPDGWPIRVMAGIEVLSELHHGALLVRADRVEVKGVAGSKLAKAKISQILSERLGKGQTFRVDVSYDKALDPLAALPTPAECATGVTAILSHQKITFAPGSAEIDANGAKVVGQIAGALEKCGALKAEIAGHTDAQGSETGNLALSQARAEAVLLALQGRQVDVSGLQAQGYGEGVPVADNGTDEGREANRRIEFTLLDQPAANAAANPAAGGTEPGAEPAANTQAAPDFSGDTSPSVAPATKTIAPKARPAKEG